MAIELAKAYVQIVPSADGIQGSVTQIIAPEAESAGRDAGEKISGGISSGLTAAAGMGAAAFTAITGAATAATGAFAASAGSVAEYGDNIDKMSQKMGMSAESYQEWDAVMRHSGTSIETMKASMKTLANAAETGSEAFDALGISQEQIANMSQEELFEATITALQNVDDETQRTYLAGKTLGRGATELGALLNTSAEDTQAMRDRVHELGGVMSDEAVKSAAAYQDSLQDMTTAMSGLKNNMIAEFLPSITQIMDGLTEIFSGNSDKGIGMVTSGINDLLSNIQSALPQLAEIATSIISAIAQTFIANLPQIVEMGLQIIGTLAGSILSSLPLIGESLLGVGEVIVNTLTEYGPTLLEQGYNMISNLALGLIENAPVMVGDFGEVISQALAFIEENLPSFLDKGIALVEQIAVGILENFPAVLENMGEIINNLVNFIMENFPTFLEKGIELLQNVGQGILDNLPEILATTAKVLADIIANFAEHLPEFLQKGFELLTEVGTGIINALPDLIAKLPQIFTDIVSELASYDWLSIGVNIIDGIADGVASMASSLVDAAVNAVGDAWDGICDWLGIASPSKKARDFIGKNWALGIGEGLEDYMPEADMVATINGTMASMTRATDAMPTIGSKTTTNDNEDIIEAIYSLRSAILSMGITLDKDEFVGGIYEKMDNALGREAVRAAWQ